MPEYLSKEEVKQWRSSLEKITLEEYATRLGKFIEGSKQTNDLVDIVLREQHTMSKADSLTQTKGEKINSIAQKTFNREKEISSTSLTSLISGNKQKSTENNPVKTTKNDKNKSIKESEELMIKEKISLTFNKTLTSREQLIFNYFAKNKNQTVYAKDLAELLDLPRDYVYKYIKNLRAKIEGDKLQNSSNGGYVLTT